MPDDYEVGYGKPPKHTRFKPGSSGNPKGRSKGSKNFGSELLEELQEQIAVKESGRRRTVSKQRAVLKSLIARAMQGDTRAASLIATMVSRFLRQDDEPEEQTDLSGDDLAILEDYARRVRKTRTIRHRSRPKQGDQS